MSLSVDIRKRLDGFTLGVRFETDDPVTGLLGASGCGKSMTLRWPPTARLPLRS